MANDITERYEGLYGGKYDGAAHLALDLMRGDKATFKLGYSFSNALNAAVSQFDLDKPLHVAIVAGKLHRIANETHDLYPGD